MMPLRAFILIYTRATLAMLRFMLHYDFMHCALMPPLIDAAPHARTLYARQMPAPRRVTRLMARYFRARRCRRDALIDFTRHEVMPCHDACCRADAFYRVRYYYAAAGEHAAGAPRCAELRIIFTLRVYAPRATRADERGQRA